MATPSDLKPYVREALTLAGYSFNEAEIERIAQQLSRFALVAAELDGIPVLDALSAAAVFRP